MMNLSQKYLFKDCSLEENLGVFSKALNFEIVKLSE
jgi:hypothetical protein